MSYSLYLYPTAAVVRFSSPPMVDSKGLFEFQPQRASGLPQHNDPIDQKPGECLQKKYYKVLTIVHHVCHTKSVLNVVL